MPRQLVLLLAIPVALNAQVGRSRISYGAEPQYWVGLSYGYLDGTTINDGATGGTWRFGYTSQLRATLEKTLQRGVQIGVSAAFASPPLTYTMPTFNNPCGQSCPATAEVTQYMLFLTGGSRVGFHSVYGGEIGFTQFSNFRLKDSDSKLPPTDSKNDFSFGFGGGFGYGFSPTTDVYATESFDFVLHDQGSSVSSSAPRLMTFRIGARIGF
jgi:hypothetical protein